MNGIVVSVLLKVARLPGLLMRPDWVTIAASAAGGRGKCLLGKLITLV
jgi:hypothetical protein